MPEANPLKNLIVWADLPVSDLDRAVAFYRAVLAIQVTRESFGGESFGLFEHGDGNGGCLVPNSGEASAQGMLIYFNVDGRIRDAVARVPANGGKVLQGVHPIGPHGFKAVILDSEGNRLALHSGVDA